MATDEHRGTTMADRRRDIAEVRSFLQLHPESEPSEVAMCCSMGRDQAKRIMRTLK